MDIQEKLEAVQAMWRTSTCMGQTPSTPEQAKKAAGQLIGVEIPKLVSALEVALEVHSADEDGACKECESGGGPVWYPCDTMKLINEALR